MLGLPGVLVLEVAETDAEVIVTIEHAVCVAKTWTGGDPALRAREVLTPRGV